jgi:photosystem II stability/assembly factor-like uncharacterized protein
VISLRRSSPMFPAVFAVFAILIYPVAQPLAGQQFNPNLFGEMRWRLIGPFRGGRALTATGVPGHPNLFYFGAVGGGVWKTTDAGRVWKPIFDQEPIASIGAIAVAPLNPSIIYVGTGEADMRSDISYGNGIYKSTDAGATWLHIGLRDSRQIGRVLIDPRNPDLVFVAALGHAYGPNAERGVFRSTDGGNTWKRVLHKDDDTGAIDLAFDPRDPQTIYAALWQTRRPPWNVYPPSNGPGSGLYKSTDGGETWIQLTGHGLPSEGLGRIGIAVAPSDPNRVYLIADAKQGGVYRSEDAGQNWRLTNNEERIWKRGWYFGGITVDPKDPSVVYIANTSLYCSRDGGAAFDAIKGAPGGDDYHSLWIDPDDPQRMVLSSDQGVIITLDGAQAWSSWYNQPTAQFYHVITDTRSPYAVYGAQQDTGAASTTSRSSHWRIDFRDWEPIEVGDENGYIAPDPLDPDVVYGGTVTRFDRSTRQNQVILPMLAHPGWYRRTWTLPLVFSPLDPHRLYFASQVLFRTTNAGQTWDVISGDLTREDPGVPANLDPATASDFTGSKRRGVIYTIAPSAIQAGLIWIGTDDGLIRMTRDEGKTWGNVTPAELTPWSKVTLIEASHFDANTAYAALDRHRLDDLQPYIYRTHDGGKTWQRITNSIPEGSYVNVVREDRVRKGLLFAGTETGVFVSFNDGDDWQPLQMNLPNASVRDLAIPDDDLVAATHGRAFWVLDNITPLRQLNEQVSASDAWLFQPQTAYRVHPSSDEGTPLPPEEPAGENPPNGAILDYYLKSAPTTPLTIEIFDGTGKLVRHYSSADQAPKIDPKELDIPSFWIHPPQPPSQAPGMHRFVWDLRYPSPPSGDSSYYAYLGFGLSPWAVPGEYTVKLTVGGRSLTQPLTLKLDPRVKTPLADLQKQFDLDGQITKALQELSAVTSDLSKLRDKLDSLRLGKNLDAPLKSAAEELQKKTEAALGPPDPEFESLGFEEPAMERDTLRFLSRTLRDLERIIESADAAPTPDAVAAFDQDQKIMRETLARWEEIRAQGLPKLNSLLQKNNLPPISLKDSKK